MWETGRRRVEGCGIPGPKIRSWAPFIVLNWTEPAPGCMAAKVGRPGEWKQVEEGLCLLCGGLVAGWG